MGEIIDMREISNGVARRLIADPAFRKAFQRDPVGTLREAGVPAQMIPADVDVDFIALGQALQKARMVRFRLAEQGLAVEGEEAIAVACVVV